jgi:long-chain acyl-CoA synthetase
MPGDVVVFCIENAPAFFYLAWGCQRIGAIYVPTSTKLSADDLAYIARDAGASVVVLSVAAEATGAAPDADFAQARLFSLGGEIAGFEGWEGAVAVCPTTLPERTMAGREMMYSSGTTGRPKGVRKPMPTGRFDDSDSRNASWKELPGFGPDMVNLCTSPLYHAAPHRNVAATLATGGTCIVMERFDPTLALDAISRYKVTQSLWVPTMFHRLLRLPLAVKQAYDLSSHQAAHHGAAPCPVHLKEAMIAWWGPILLEYYAGTEGIGACTITSEEWLRHKGSVGRATDGVIHILDESEDEVPAGRTGTVFFEGSSTFAYWKDDEKTARSRSRHGWWTYGDIGHVDDEGYLYLTDRRDFVVISGGVNIYPQEIEDFLLRDDRVLDAAVFGIPDVELGEVVQAVVQVADASQATESVGEALRQQCRLRLGPIKAPKSIHIVTDFPRLPTGKLQKKALREQFLAELGQTR